MNSPRDENRTAGLIAKSDADNTPVTVEADPVTKRLKVNATITGGGDGAILDGVSSSIKATVTGANALKVDNSAVTQPVSIASMPTTTVQATNLDTRDLGFATDKVDVSGSTIAHASSSRSDTYTVTGNGTTVNVSTAPLKYFAVQVKGTGAAATTWDIRLEGSLNGTDFSQILAHTNATTDGAVLWLTTTAPTMYFRSRCAGLVLGTATNIIVTIVGQV